jgi:hypothetical protein
VPSQKSLVSGSQFTPYKVLNTGPRYKAIPPKTFESGYGSGRSLYKTPKVMSLTKTTPPSSFTKSLRRAPGMQSLASSANLVSSADLRKAPAQRKLTQDQKYPGAGGSILSYANETLDILNKSFN